MAAAEGTFSWPRTATPRVLLTSAPQARVALEPHLRAWEIKSLLRPVPHHIRFALKKVEFAAVARGEGGQNELTLRPIERHGQFTADAAITRENAAYPEPDPSFSATPVVEGLSHWIEPLLRGHGDLLVDAYRVLTRVEAENTLYTSPGPSTGTTHVQDHSEQHRIRRDVSRHHPGPNDDRTRAHSSSTVEPISGPTPEWIPRGRVQRIRRETYEPVTSPASGCRCTSSAG